MSDIEIVRGIGIPAPISHGAKAKYPFATLEVGDGFIVAERSDRIRAAAGQWGARTGRKFSTRKQTDGRILVVRVS